MHIVVTVKYGTCFPRTSTAVMEGAKLSTVFSNKLDAKRTTGLKKTQETNGISTVDGFYNTVYLVNLQFFYLEAFTYDSKVMHCVHVCTLRNQNHSTVS